MSSQDYDSSELTQSSSELVLIDTVLHRPDDAECSRRKEEPSLTGESLPCLPLREMNGSEGSFMDRQADYDLNSSVLTEPLNLHLQGDGLVFVGANKIMAPATYEIRGDKHCLCSSSASEEFRAD